MEIKFGDQIVVNASPKLQLNIAESADKWLHELIKKEHINSDIECLAFAQEIIKVLADNGSIVPKNQEDKEARNGTN